MPCHTVERKPDWESALVQWLQQAIKTPFVWGQFDCVLAAADAVNAQTGYDFATAYRGCYSTDKGALKQLKRRGYESVFDVVAKALDGEAVAPAQLQRGDIGGATLPTGKTLGLIWADRLWLPSEKGLTPVSMQQVECGWRLPCPQ